MVEPAATSITTLLGVVGLGPPLQAMYWEVTSVIGPSYEGSRMPTPTPFTTPLATRLVMMVWAEAPVSAAAAATEDENFMVKVFED